MYGLCMRRVISAIFPKPRADPVQKDFFRLFVETPGHTPYTSVPVQRAKYPEKKAKKAVQNVPRTRPLYPVHGPCTPYTAPVPRTRPVYPVPCRCTQYRPSRTPYTPVQASGGTLKLEIALHSHIFNSGSILEVVICGP